MLMPLQGCPVELSLLPRGWQTVTMGSVGEFWNSGAGKPQGTAEIVLAMTGLPGHSPGAA